MLNHKGTQMLETERLILKKISIFDAHDMYNNWANNDNVTKYLPWSTHKNEEETKKIVTMWVNDYTKADTYLWVIYLKSEDTIIGTIAVVNITEKYATCEVGYCIGEKWWGNGYTAEALKTVCNFLFNEVGFNRIEAKHNIENPNSGKVMEKVGLIKEGILRQRGISNTNIYIDVCLHGILKEDFNKNIDN